jgi:DNA-binding GntR family transcriptional regulator
MLADILLEQIADMSPGEQLPSISTLVTAYWVAPNTVCGAIGILAAAGLVETHQGHGTFICQDAA